jgi:hypothetical protein
VSKKKAYTSALEHAATALIEAINFEHAAIAELEGEVMRLLTSAEADYARYRDLAGDPDFDDEGIATASCWHAHFDESRAAKLDQEADALGAQIATRIHLRNFPQLSCRWRSELCRAILVERSLAARTRVKRLVVKI